tara:strand:+ start:107 stop:709 length:603 start_codon:yes stop_codon:yes gene_type:complete
MFQNDVSFIYKDIDQETENIKEVIKDLMIKHLEESVAGPFFYDYELNDLKDQLPENFSLEIDKKKNVPENKIRLTVVNAYFDATRHFDDYLDELDDDSQVKLVAEPIGCIELDGEETEAVLAITSIDAPYDEENELSLLELSDASGDSPIKIAVTPGENFDLDTCTFSCPGEYADDDFELDNSKVEEIISFIKGLVLIED